LKISGQPGFFVIAPDPFAIGHCGSLPLGWTMSGFKKSDFYLVFGLWFSSTWY